MSGKTEERLKASRVAEFQRMINLQPRQFYYANVEVLAGINRQGYLSWFLWNFWIHKFSCAFWGRGEPPLYDKSILSCLETTEGLSSAGYHVSPQGLPSILLFVTVQINRIKSHHNSAGDILGLIMEGKIILQRASWFICAVHKNINVIGFWLHLTKVKGS